MRFLVTIPSWNEENGTALDRATELVAMIGPHLTQDQEIRVASYPDVPLGTCGRTSGLCRLNAGHRGVCIFDPEGT